MNILGAILGACLPTWKPLSGVAETAVHSEPTASKPDERGKRIVVYSDSILTVRPAGPHLRFIHRPSEGADSDIFQAI